MPLGVVAFVLIVAAAAGVARLVPLRFRAVVWTLVIIGGVVPWASWTDHAHWGRIEWLPFTRNVRLRDVLLNILFYVPFGYFVTARRAASTRANVVLAAAGLAFGLSAITELSQVFSHGRFPAMTDVVTNTTGAVIGAWLASRRR